MSVAIDLEKGSQIAIQSTSLSVGVNWSAIPQKKYFFGLLGGGWEAVNLDISAAIFDEHKEMIDMVYPANPQSKDGLILHSGDDISGDIKADTIDNEIIKINLEALAQQPSLQIFFFLNSIGGFDFAQIPYTKLNLRSPEQHLSTFDVAAHEGLASKKSLLMGKLFIKDGQWQFFTIGEGFASEKRLATISAIREIFL
ncbi:MAG: TerD family protein [Bernardetiaceae bacterium]|nr:TerD family protein [Bernardetiaceae bacterium]